jgi:hypothetical protein
MGLWQEDTKQKGIETAVKTKKKGRRPSTAKSASYPPRTRVILIALMPRWHDKNLGRLSAFVADEMRNGQTSNATWTTNGIDQCPSDSYDSRNE